MLSFKRPLMTPDRRTVVLSLALAGVLALASTPSAAEPWGAVQPVAGPTPEPVPFPLDFETPALERDLESALRAQGWGDLMQAGDLAVALVDLSGGNVRYAGVNDDRMIYAASLPKIAILLGAFDALDRGTMQWTPELRGQLTDMIRVSSNSAATAVLDKVGFESIARSVQESPHAFYEPGVGGLWVGKAYGRNDYWQRDPVANTSHGATARQAARFFVLLEKGMLVSPGASARMKDILGNPGIKHKFVRGLASHDEATVYRKSGTWRDFHADAALVEDGDRKWVAVGLTRHPEGSRVLEELIVVLDDLVHEAAD
jgi:beta-lactamase class A